MTTMQIQDIKRKKSVGNRYAPSSYRIFSEEVSNQGLPHDQIYTHQAPQIYTQPSIVPAQSIEVRNNPHAGRNAGFLRENVQSLNEPINTINTRNDHGAEGKNRWWEWNTPKEEMDILKSKKRIIHNPVSNNPNDLNSYATTYQKDLGALNNVLEPGTQIGGGQNDYNRHVPPQAIGVVPINDLNGHTRTNEPQRTFVDKMSFEHNYDSRNNDNYAQRGRRQGAFVLDQIEPNKPSATRTRPSSNAGSSVWNAMHPNDKFEDPQSRQPSGLRKFNQSQKASDQRRDPIGYFNDQIAGGSYGNNLPRNNSNGNFQTAPIQNEPQMINNSYEPSWNSGNQRYEAKEQFPTGPYDPQYNGMQEPQSYGPYDQQNGGPYDQQNGGPYDQQNNEMYSNLMNSNQGQQ